MLQMAALYVIHHFFLYLFKTTIRINHQPQDVYRDITASGEPAIPNIKDLLKPEIKKADMNELWDVQLKKWNYQCEYLAKWREVEEQLGKELDAIIAPITPTAAIRHNQFKYYGYASAINLLDFTSVVVPVTFADKAVDAKKENYQPLNELDGVVQAECKFLFYELVMLEGR